MCGGDCNSLKKREDWCDDNCTRHIEDHCGSSCEGRYLPSVCDQYNSCNGDRDCICDNIEKGNTGFGTINPDTHCCISANRMFHCNSWWSS